MDLKGMYQFNPIRCLCEYLNNTPTICNLSLAVYGHSLIINLSPGMYQEIHPYRALGINSVKINTWWLWGNMQCCAQSTLPDIVDNSAQYEQCLTMQSVQCLTMDLNFPAFWAVGTSQRQCSGQCASKTMATLIMFTWKFYNMHRSFLSQHSWFSKILLQFETRNKYRILFIQGGLQKS